MSQVYDHKKDLFFIFLQILKHWIINSLKSYIATGYAQEWFISTCLLDYNMLFAIQRVLTNPTASALLEIIGICDRNP